MCTMLCSRGAAHLVPQGEGGVSGASVSLGHGRRLVCRGKQPVVGHEGRSGGCWGSQAHYNVSQCLMAHVVELVALGARIGAGAGHAVAQLDRDSVLARMAAPLVEPAGARASRLSLQYRIWAAQTACFVALTRRDAASAGAYLGMCRTAGAQFSVGALVTGTKCIVPAEAADFIVVDADGSEPTAAFSDIETRVAALGAAAAAAVQVRV